MGGPDEPQPGHDGQRRPGDQQRLGVLDQGVAELDPLLGTFSPKKTTSGLSTPPQASHGTIRNVSMPSTSGVAVGRDVAREIPCPKPGLAASSRWCSRARSVTLAAVQADHGADPAVQVDHLAAAGRLVQAVDVLGDQGRSRPERSIAARARWPSLGSARCRCCQPM